MDFGIAGVAAITVICFLASEAAKVLGARKDLIPVLCGFVGCILGIIGMRIMTDFPAQDTMTAAAVGIVSGLAATGAHQIYKQYKKG